MKAPAFDYVQARDSTQAVSLYETAVVSMRTDVAPMPAQPVSVITS